MQDRAQTSTREIQKRYKIGIEVLRRKNLKKKRISSRNLKKACTIKASSATKRRHLNRIGQEYTKKPKTFLLTLIQKEKREENCERWIADRVDW